MTDGGGEFKSDEWIETLKGMGIKISTSVPYTPQQNGRAERINRTIMEKPFRFYAATTMYIL